MVAKFFKAGVGASHNKDTSNSHTQKMNEPKTIVLPMLQHKGEICEPLVKKGDAVKVGQKIGESDKLLSSPIYSSVSGIVTDVSPRISAGGANIISVEIENDFKGEIHEDIKIPVIKNKDDFLLAIRNSGLIGLGGAGFPTHIKLSPPADKQIDTLIINAAESEPYITSDYREMIENVDSVAKGIKLVQEYLGIKNVIIGIENNKPQAIKNLINATQGENIKVTSLKTIYHQGAEKMLIYALTGRKVPKGGLPLDVGVIVLNVSTVSFIDKYLQTGIPLITKRITVDGSAVKNPGNFEVPIGIKISDVFQFAGGFKSDPFKVIMGGPMMGLAQYSLDVTVTKSTNALLAFDKEEGNRKNEEPCIRCSKCVQVCPVKLVPLFIDLHSEKENIEELKELNVNDCIECGCCSFVCPAKRHLVQSIRLAKIQLQQNKVKGGE